MRASFTLLLLSFLSAPARGQVVIDLEDLPLSGPNTFFNGASNVTPPATVSTTPFVSRGASFNNRYDTAFGGSWAGWAYSNVVNVTTPGFGNQYAAYHLPGGGGDASAQYAVAFQDTFTPVTPTVTLPAGTRPQSVRLTNTTYTGLSMRNGDGFAKKFGGPTGNDPDFFRLTVQGRDALGALLGSVDFFLADYRFANNAQDYIVSEWTTVDLSGLPASSARLTFTLASSDNGPFGMNTPAYFALDNLRVVAVPEPGALALVAAGAAAGWGRWRARRRV